MNMRHEEGNVECNTGMHGWKPVQLFQCRRDVVCGTDLLTGLGQ